MKRVFKLFMIVLLLIPMFMVTSCGYASNYRKLNAYEQKLFNAFKSAAGATPGNNKVNNDFKEFKILKVEEEIAEGKGYIVRVSFPNGEGKVEEHLVMVSITYNFSGWDLLKYAYPDVPFTSYSDSYLSTYSFDIEQDTIICLNGNGEGYCECNTDMFNSRLTFKNSMIKNHLCERESHTEPKNVNSNKIVKTWNSYIKKYGK